jgi:hypothetical protein
MEHFPFGGSILRLAEIPMSKSNEHKVERPCDGDGYTWLHKATLFAFLLVFTNLLDFDIIAGAQGHYGDTTRI